MSEFIELRGHQADRKQKGTLIPPKETTVQAPCSGENRVCVQFYLRGVLVCGGSRVRAPCTLSILPLQSEINSTKPDQRLTISLSVQMLNSDDVNPVYNFTVKIYLTCSFSVAEWVCRGAVSRLFTADAKPSSVHPKAPLPLKAFWLHTFNLCFCSGKYSTWVVLSVCAY